MRDALTGRLAGLTACALLPRLFLFFLNENLYGDAVARTELALKWAEHPHWMSSFADGPYQFGPLHLYLIGALTWLWPNPDAAGRFVSLVFGTLSVVPMYFLTRRLWGERAAVWACLGLSVWGMHLQFSTTAGSEALGLFLMLSALACFARGVQSQQFGPLAACAVFLNLACATRYDAWMYIPLLGLFLWLLQRASRPALAAFAVASAFVGLCLVFPAVWMLGNWQALGDPLYPIHYVDAFHREWIKSEIAHWGERDFRLMGLFFWPGTALVTLTPPLALCGFIGMFRLWKEKPKERWLVYVIALPTAYFAFRAAALLTFVPLARFPAVHVALCLPFVEPGFAWAFSRATAGIRRAAVAWMAIVAVGFTVWLGHFTYRKEGKYEDTLRPISPTSTNISSVRKVARFIREEIAAKGATLVLDAEPHYLDMQVAFYSGMPKSKMAQARSNEFWVELSALVPEYIICAEGGALDAHMVPGAANGEIVFGKRTFQRLPGLPAPFRAYRQVQAR